jgi:hypothetical protein
MICLPVHKGTERTLWLALADFVDFGDPPAAPAARLDAAGGLHIPPPG